MILQQQHQIHNSLLLENLGLSAIDHLQATYDRVRTTNSNAQQRPTKTCHD